MVWQANCSWKALDLVFNVSGIYHDVQTLLNPDASGWAKGGAFLDLSVSIFTDINMLHGEGEAVRAAEVGAEIAEKGSPMWRSRRERMR